MRSLLELPTGRRIVSELADWAEASTLFRNDRTFSVEDVVRALIAERGGFDADDDDDFAPDPHPNKFESKARALAELVFNEIEDRQHALGTDPESAPVRSYPFELEGDVIRLRDEVSNLPDPEAVYLFLLAITRASMDSRSRTLAGFDATRLFEQLCADVLASFWRSDDTFAGTFMVGTSSGTSRLPFSQLIEQLCGSIRDGDGWKSTAIPPGAGDGGLDIVVWRRFSDCRPGSLIGFAQCKTGDHWRDHLGRHNPISISNKFFRRPLIVEPIPIYMVPCRVERTDWDDSTIQHRGILFDRCRIAHYASSAPNGTVGNLRQWVDAALDRERTHLENQLQVDISN